MKRLIGALALAALAVSAQAQTFPSRPITMVVALPAGGGVDALARVLAEHMRGTLARIWTSSSSPASSSMKCLQSWASACA